MLEVGQIVDVSPRTWVGINQQGGVARITAVYPNANGVVDRVDVHYIVGQGRKERALDVKYVHEYKELDRRSRTLRSRGSPRTSASTSIPTKASSMTAGSSTGQGSLKPSSISTSRTRDTKPVLEDTPGSETGKYSVTQKDAPRSNPCQKIQRGCKKTSQTSASPSRGHSNNLSKRRRREYVDATINAHIPGISTSFPYNVNEDTVELDKKRRGRSKKKTKTEDPPYEEKEKKTRGHRQKSTNSFSSIVEATGLPSLSMTMNQANENTSFMNIGQVKKLGDHPRKGTPSTQATEEPSLRIMAISPTDETKKSQQLKTEGHSNKAALSVLAAGDTPFAGILATTLTPTNENDTAGKKQQQKKPWACARRVTPFESAPEGSPFDVTMTNNAANTSTDIAYKAPQKRHQRGRPNKEMLSESLVEESAPLVKTTTMTTTHPPEESDAAKSTTRHNTPRGHPREIIPYATAGVGERPCPDTSFPSGLSTAATTKIVEKSKPMNTLKQMTLRTPEVPVEKIDKMRMKKRSGDNPDESRKSGSLSKEDETIETAICAFKSASADDGAKEISPEQNGQQHQQELKEQEGSPKKTLGKFLPKSRTRAKHCNSVSSASKKKQAKLSLFFSPKARSSTTENIVLDQTFPEKASVAQHSGESSSECSLVHSKISETSTALGKQSAKAMASKQMHDSKKTVTTKKVTKKASKSVKSFSNTRKQKKSALIRKTTNSTSSLSKAPSASLDGCPSERIVTSASGNLTSHRKPKKANPSKSTARGIGEMRFEHDPSPETGRTPLENIFSKATNEAHSFVQEVVGKNDMSSLLSMESASKRTLGIDKKRHEIFLKMLRKFTISVGVDEIALGELFTNIKSWMDKNENEPPLTVAEINASLEMEEQLNHIMISRESTPETLFII